MNCQIKGDAMDEKITVEMDAAEIRLTLEAVSKLPLAMVDPRYRVALRLVNKLQAGAAQAAGASGAPKQPAPASPAG